MTLKNLNKLFHAAIACALLAMPRYAFAHNASQLPFLRINGTDAAVYPVGSTSLINFTLPQDLATDSYMVKTPVSFELQTVNLPILPEYVAKTTFSWNFSDGTTATGLSQTHTFAKIGSYVVTVTSANSQDLSTPQLLDALYVNIVPSKDYKIPASVIHVNDKGSTNPYTDILRANIHKNMYFDASPSMAGTAPITSYFWDFGDQQTGTKRMETHVFDSRLEYVLPLLRVTDANGFFSDQLVQIENNPNAPVPSPPATPAPIPPSSSRTFFPVASFAIVVVLIVAALRIKNNKKSRR
jgi:hypothetical protein